MINEIEKQQMSSRRGITKADYQAKGILYLPENARFSYLLNLPEGEDIGKAINDGMKAIEKENFVYRRTQYLPADRSCAQGIYT